MLLPCGSASRAAVCAAGDVGMKVFQYLQTQLTVSTKVVNIVISLGLHYSGVVFLKKKKRKNIVFVAGQIFEGEKETSKIG